jgi:excisionase family DNA binding protein
VPEQPTQLTVPVLVTIPTAAKLLGCSARTVRRRIATGLLPAVIEGGQVKVRADELRRYIEALDRPCSSAPAGRRRRPRPNPLDYGFLRE